MKITLVFILALLVSAVGPVAFDSAIAPSASSSTESVRETRQRVEIIRTAYGVPHIRAEDLRAAGYGLAWVQSEDHGPRTGMRVLAASGRWATVEGHERIDSDFAIRREHNKNRAKYASLAKDVRDVYEGFAEGLNRFIELNPRQFPSGMPTDLTGFDVLATEFSQPSAQKVRNFINKLNNPDAPADDDDDAEGEGPDDGSNAWALAPSRTTSGKAILVRNPHLRWSAGYYEAHMTVPGVIDFYGDFRIGGAFGVIGGFNRDLGFSTTNNNNDLDEIYELDADPKSADHFLLDGRSVALRRELITVPFRNGDAIATETREFWSTEFGPVIHRANGKIYIFKYAGDGEIRGGEQFLRMMRAKNLQEYTDAMKMRARLTSNFTYADREGNIYYLWNAALPLLPHPTVDEVTAVPAKRAADMWSRYVPFEALPQVLNPPGGYIRNENNSHHYTNTRAPANLKNAYPNFEQPRLSLRSQLGIQLIDPGRKLSLEDNVELKHNYRALLADRVKGDLISAAKASGPNSEMTAAVRLLEAWDNTTSAESRGSVLFQLWWNEYSALNRPERRAFPDSERYAKVWSTDDPYNTPRGLANNKRAMEALSAAIAEVKERYGSVDVSWGDVHRVRRGNVDEPVGGCGNDLGCFRIMTYERDKDGKMAAIGGDGWVFAVEFGDVPRAYTILAYGQSNLPDSPHFADQAAMFARGEMKTVAFTQADIKARAIRTYRPGSKEK